MGIFPFRAKIIQIGIVLGCLMLPLNCLSATLSSTVKDAEGQPVKDAVVYAKPVNAGSMSLPKSPETVMDQVDREFVPYVLPIQVGTAVRFPNKDNIQHNVYSVSPAKEFQLPLYKGTPTNTVLFDKPGQVVLGCNIHDWMVAHIYVLDTPYFAKTGQDGLAELGNLSPEQYEVRVWHPLMKESTESTGKRLSLSTQGGKVDFVISLKPNLRPPRISAPGGGGYH